MTRPDFIALTVGLALALLPSLSSATSEDELKRQLIAAAQRSQDNEERVSRIEAQLLDLSRQEAELSAALHGRRAAQTAALGALMRISRQPPQALIATPAAVDDTIRTSLLLGSTASRLGEEARDLGAALVELTALHRRIASRRMELDAAATGLADERARLEALYVRAVARRGAVDEQKALAAERAAREAESLQELLGKLSLEAPAPPREKPRDPAGTSEPSAVVLALREDTAAPDRPGAPISAARGSLPMPARGRLIGLFGDGESGVKSKGITIETRDDAQVITPYDGEVVYAGNYRGYGRLLIIDHGEGYHTLLAGFSRIDSILGQWLLAGEPVGVMGRGFIGYKSLYVEFRHDGVAINPLPWLTAVKQKADG